MKKTISLMMALAVAGTMAAPAMAANDEPMVIAPAPNTQSQQVQMKIVVKGQTMPMQTISVNGCTMAPVRAIAEALGFKVTWNAARFRTFHPKGKLEILLVADQNVRDRRDFRENRAQLCFSIFPEGRAIV